MQTWFRLDFIEIQRGNNSSTIKARPCLTVKFFLAPCDAILLLGDVKLANTCFGRNLLMYS